MREREAQLKKEEEEDDQRLSGFDIFFDAAKDLVPLEAMMIVELNVFADQKRLNRRLR